MTVEIEAAHLDGLFAEPDPSFGVDVLRGLSWAQRAVPARWLYDRRGSELFEAITELPEYYASRTERSILERHASEIAKLTGPGRVVVELGSGSSTKTPILLSAIAPTAYVPIDISAEFLHRSVRELARMFPRLPMRPVVGDFMKPLTVPVFARSPMLCFFPGSTIGNLVAPAAVDLLRAMAAMLGADSQLLIGIDGIKSEDILLPAYDDAQGITAEFNLNLLHRINRELSGTVPVRAFRHRARWNELETRIEMHLEATADVSFDVAGQRFQMGAGQTIHTENSIKYGSQDMRVLLRAGGWTPLKEWTDGERLFTVVLAEVAAHSPAP